MDIVQRRSRNEGVLLSGGSIQEESLLSGDFLLQTGGEEVCHTVSLVWRAVASDSVCSSSEHLE